VLSDDGRRVFGNSQAWDDFGTMIRSKKFLFYDLLKEAKCRVLWMTKVKRVG
jgi:hypothetical protein